MKIAITGGLGFIGSSLINFLNKKNIIDIDIYESDLNCQVKLNNVKNLKYNCIYPNKNIFKNINKYDSIIHLGANSDTSQEHTLVNWNNNVDYSIELLKAFSINIKSSFIFASSASVYGSEYKDFSERVDLKPTNFYGLTKLEVDKFIISNYTENNRIFSLRFFNAYGARENHKLNNKISSPIYKWLNYSKLQNNKIDLFESNNRDFSFETMARDFIYIDDICKIIWHCIKNKPQGGIYNVGSGIATTWLNLAKECILQSKNLKNAQINKCSMPQLLSHHYQYYTCANLQKLRKNLKFSDEFTNIHDGINQTIQEIKNIQ